MKFESFNDNDRFKIHLQMKQHGYASDSEYVFEKYANISKKELFNILKDNGAIISNVKDYSYNPYQNYQYYFKTKEASDKAVEQLNLILDTYQEGIKQKNRQQREIAKSKPAHLYIIETIGEGKKNIKIYSTIMTKKNNVMYNSYQVNNSYHIAKLPQYATKEICKEFEKYKFTNFIEAIKVACDIAEPYIMMEKISN